MPEVLLWRFSRDPLAEKEFHTMHSSSVTGEDDLINISDSPDIVLKNLELRYNKDIIYTYVGKILVAVNPYKILDIYSEENMSRYRKKRLNQLPPHIFAVADYSFEDMLKRSKKQCLIVTGESGAGKTETTKFFLQYLTRISNEMSAIENQILLSNPILEAFGNAKTTYNDNSSRFGKYTVVLFDKNGCTSGASIKHYLLENSRVVRQNPDEENYHIFYMMLSDLNKEEQFDLGLHELKTFNYLNRRKSEGEEERKRESLTSIKIGMKALDFSESDIWSTFELLSAILHIGEITYEVTSEGGVDSVQITPTQNINFLTKLLKIEKNILIDSLTKQRIRVKDNYVFKFLSKEEAQNSQDGFAKRIYVNLFDYLIGEINKILLRDEKETKEYIGILDMYGFEAFENNSFEQLCVNYANEKLQQFFISQVFKAEEEESTYEGIEWKIDYTDNKGIQELIESEPNGILSIINDASKIPSGNNQTILDKAVEHHSASPFFVKPKTSNVKAFGLKHYADVVTYEIRDLIEKNQNACSLSTKNIIETSENVFLKKIFARDFDPSSNAFTKRAETIIPKFKSSLNSLINELSNCETSFVRCIKPNNEKKPNFFDTKLCLKQLNYLGVTEIIKIRQYGYAVRYEYPEFVKIYSILLPHSAWSFEIMHWKEATRKICERVFHLSDDQNYKFGKSKIFLKPSADTQLQEEKDLVLNSKATLIQKTVRAYLARKRYNKLKKAVLKIEGQILKKKSINEKHKIELKYNQYLITRLQAWCRGYLMRNFKKNQIEEMALQKSMKLLRENPVADFQVFAKTYFQNDHNYQFSKKPIKTPLLRLLDENDITASEVIWMTILRFLGNVKDLKNNPKNIAVKPHLRSVLTKIRNLIANEQNVEVNTTQNLKCLYDTWLRSRSTYLEKLEFIIIHGIERFKLRDEIYCQICKALTKNPKKKAEVWGWNLLISCLSCFEPSDLLLPHLKSFIRQGPKNNVSYCLLRLNRTIQNGKRTHAPCYTEFKAIQQQKQIEIEVFLTNGLVLPTKIDSATTAREMLDIVAENVKLKDTFGFSIVLAHDLKHLSLGDGSDFVMDIVAQCEQYAFETGDDFKTLPWKFYLKKEMFAPWHDYKIDETSTELICSQIADGVRTGEYECEVEDIGWLVADMCYVDRGKIPLPTLKKIIKQYLPHYFYSFSSEEVSCLEEQVMVAFLEMINERSPPIESIQGSLVKFAMRRWPLHFSRKFHVLGSFQKEKRPFSYLEVPLVIAVNSHGIIVIVEHDEEREIMKIQFVDIKDIVREDVEDGKSYFLIITSYTGMTVILLQQSPFEGSLHELLLNMIDSLKKFSKFVVATQDYKISDSSFLTLKKGDLIMLNDRFKGEDLIKNSWAEGTNLRSGLEGNFLLDCVKIIPTIQKPFNLKVAGVCDEKNNSEETKFDKSYMKLKYYNLEDYAKTHFTTQNLTVPDPREFSFTQLQQPLHFQLSNDKKLSAEALQCYQNIVKFLRNNKNSSSEEDAQITEKIFGPPIKKEALRDEIYCQIMKQLASNPDSFIKDRAWELLWMATGLFGCGKDLAKEIVKFLMSRSTLQSATECLFRFHTALKSRPRTQPPHLIEVEAVKHKPSQILHKINFPDGSHMFVQMTSLTKVKDLNDNILNRLKISTSKGFSLCVQIVGRLFVLLGDFYIFDYFQLLENWMRKYKISTSKCQYQLYFIKKSWKDIVPGEDKVVDSKFVYPQEYNKYTKGFYKDIPFKDISEIASLLYGLYFNGKIKLSKQLLHKLVPEYILKSETEILVKEINKLNMNPKSMTQEEKKIEFLKYLHKLQPYGLQHFGMKNLNSDISNYIFYPITSSTKLISL